MLLLAIDDLVPAYERDPRYRLVARYDELSTDERREMDDTLATINGLEPVARITWPQQHPEQWARLQELRRRSGRAAAFLGTPLDAARPPPGG
jgi:hypothetical protein